MRKPGSVLLLMFLTVVAGTSNAQLNLPEGWRAPKAQELALTDNTWRNSSREKYLVVRADFDGDGKEDQAQLLVNADGTTYGLFILLGSGSAVVLDYRDVSSLTTMGIDKLSPGTHKTACGKGYGDCKAGEPESVRLRAIVKSCGLREIRRRPSSLASSVARTALRPRTARRPARPARARPRP